MAFENVRKMPTEKDIERMERKKIVEEKDKE